MKDFFSTSISVVLSFQGKPTEAVLTKCLKNPNTWKFIVLCIQTAECQCVSCADRSFNLIWDISPSVTYWRCCCIYGIFSGRFSWPSNSFIKYCQYLHTRNCTFLAMFIHKGFYKLINCFHQSLKSSSIFPPLFNHSLTCVCGLRCR